MEKINSGEEHFSSENLAAIVREIFVIGAESESVMMRWALRLLSCHPVVQERVQKEIDQVAGQGKEVRWDMRDRMPYTMATLKEIQRFSDIAPTGLMHKTVCDVSLDGFNLPQDTLVLANHSACHKV